MKTTT